MFQGGQFRAINDLEPPSLLPSSTHHRPQFLRLGLVVLVLHDLGKVTRVRDERTSGLTP